MAHAVLPHTHTTPADHEPVVAEHTHHHETTGHHHHHDDPNKAPEGPSEPWQWLLSLHVHVSTPLPEGTYHLPASSEVDEDLPATTLWDTYYTLPSADGADPFAKNTANPPPLLYQPASPAWAKASGLRGPPAPWT